MKDISNIIEALLLVAGEPLSMARFLQLFNDPSHCQQCCTAADIQLIITQLQQDYAARGIELKQLASGYCFQVRQDYAAWVIRLQEQRPPKYSRALLETLAIIAYRQPVTRAAIEAIRGVAVSSNIMKTIIERDWVKVVGHRDVPGKPAIYATTTAFLDYFNLTSIEELPKLQEIKDNYGTATHNELPLDLLSDILEQVE